MIKTAPYFNIPDDQIVLSFCVPNQISLHFHVADNQIALCFMSLAISYSSKCAGKSQNI